MAGPVAERASLLLLIDITRPVPQRDELLAVQRAVGEATIGSIGCRKRPSPASRNAGPACTCSNSPAGRREPALSDRAARGLDPSTRLTVTDTGLRGVSKIEFYAGGDGRPLGIKEVTSAGDPQDAVSIRPGEQATMVLVVPTTAADPVPGDCLEGAAFAGVTLPGETTSIEAWPSDRALQMPAVCGAVQVGPWEKGGAPGVN